MIRAICFGSVASLAALLVGCNPPGKIKEEVIDVPQNPPISQAKQLLEAYAKGQPLGSEASSYDQLVADVRKTDPVRADVLEKGFAELRKPNANTAAKAKEMLKELAPKMTGE
ncbi:MAG: hypothetical protein C0467_10825 [Planctomycetaceae bacterium]|nr:hypothetical protein [Planctomycetaceae bacterium]